MVESALDRTLPEADIREMIQLVDPAWDLRSSAFMEDGVSAIYRVGVETDTGVEEYFLKATPVLPGADIHPRVGAEARLSECVRRHTEIPVPTVVGAVDDHDTVRTPFFLMEAMPGTDNDMDALFEISVEAMATLARETGRYMGQLHGLETPNLTRFGKGITYDSDIALEGGQPSGDPTELTFPDGYASWRARLRDWIDDDLDALAESERFEDLLDPIEHRLQELVERLPDSLSPVAGRVDQGLWNLLTDETCSRATAWLDWGSLYAVPPAFDLAVVEYFLGGGPWAVLDDVPDYRVELQRALLDGYLTEQPLPEAYALQRECYLLDTITLTLSALDKDERKPRHLPEARVDEAADGMRTHVRRLLANGSGSGPPG